jgi:hypothetical protein
MTCDATRASETRFIKFWKSVTEEIALRQDLHVQVGARFLERTQGKLQERAGAIIEQRPELEHYFDD